MADLQALLHREVPLSAQMGVAAESYDRDTLVLTAELEPNINIHGTAFGGSLYSLAALCGWSLQAEVVVGSARIDYRKPARSRLVARAACGARGLQAFMERVRRGRRAGVEVPVAIGSVSGGEWREAALFTGTCATV